MNSFNVPKTSHPNKRMTTITKKRRTQQDKNALIVEKVQMRTMFVCFTQPDQTFKFTVHFAALVSKIECHYYTYR